MTVCLAVITHVARSWVFNLTAVCRLPSLLHWHIPQYLEWREKQYDLRYRSDVFGKESNGQPLVQGALIYIATPDRCSYGSRLPTFAFCRSDSCWLAETVLHIALLHKGGLHPATAGGCLYRTKNVNWLGAAPLEELAHQIAHAHGPSGPNSEYLYRLADTMRKVGTWFRM
jgi:cation transport regulator ChaC